MNQIAISGLLQTAATGATGSSLGMFLPIVLIFVIFYFLLIRPQNKKQKETKAMLAAMKKGDKVVSIGGIRGTLTNVKEGTVTVKVDDNCKLEFNKSAIAEVLTDKPANAAPTAPAGGLLGLGGLFKGKAKQGETSEAKGEETPDDTSKE